MENILITIIIALSAVIVGLLYVLNKRLVELQKKAENDQSQEVIVEWLKDMRGSLDKNMGQVQNQLHKSNVDLNKRLDNAAKVIGSVSKELGEMSEIGRQMQELQDFLKSPKMRGNVGEQILRDLLEQVLPREHFKLQYSFKEGKTVDAIIKTDRGLIPIDSKFPMESFLKAKKAESEKKRESHRKKFVRDVKKHVDDISKKYILPQEGTVDFAIMYIPSEPVYYEIVLNSEDLNTHAYKKKVLFVSPNSFYYFLKVVLMGLQEKKVAEGARKILETLEGIKHEADKFEKDLSVLSGHIGRAKNSMDSVSNKYQSLTSKISQVRHLKEEQPTLNIEVSDDEE